MSKVTSLYRSSPQFVDANLGKLVENNWLKILGGKLVEKQLAENSATENSSEVQKIMSAKYSANFVVIVLCYEVLNYDEVLHCKQ